MVLELSQMITHTPHQTKEKQMSDDEVRKLVLKLMIECGINPSGAGLNKDETFQMDGNPDLKLHGLMMKAEEYGLTMKYTKKTLIEFC